MAKEKEIEPTKEILMDGASIGTSNKRPSRNKIMFETASMPRIALGKTVFQRRKFSFPTIGHNLSESADCSPLPNSTKRRFSNVSDVVTRKLSNTIGWRTVPVPTHEVIVQGRVLCGQYIRNRLKRSGIFNKKLGLYRLTSTIGSANATVVREVIPGLISAGSELEHLYPKLYSNVARQATLTPGGVLISGKAAAALLVAVGQELFKSDINWGKVVSMFSVAGGLAVDCVYQGHPEYLQSLVDGMVEVLENDLAEWIANNGGWTTLSNQCRNPDEEISIVEYATIVGIIVATLFVIYLILRFVWHFGFV